MIADHLRTVSLSSDRNQTGVVKPLNGNTTFPLSTNVLKLKKNNSPYQDRGSTADREGHNYYTNM